MIELMARETPDNFRKALSRKAELLAFLKAGEEEMDDPNLSPESQDALDATMSEERQIRAALQVWKELTPGERKTVEEMLERAGVPDPDDKLYYDLTTMLPD